MLRGNWITESLTAGSVLYSGLPRLPTSCPVMSELQHAEFFSLEVGYTKESDFSVDVCGCDGDGGQGNKKPPRNLHSVQTNKIKLDVKEKPTITSKNQIKR